MDIAETTEECLPEDRERQVSETTEEFLPEDWERQTFRKYFRGRIVDVLPEAWELRNLPKPVNRSNLHSPTAVMHHGKDTHIMTEVCLLLAVRCLQRKEIEDFSLTINRGKNPTITLTYLVDDSHIKLRFLVRYIPEHLKNKRRMFMSNVLETYFDNISPSNKILYTNMRWKQKPAPLNKLNFQSKETSETYSELQRMRITDKCYSLSDFKQQPPPQGYHYYSDAFFVLAAQQPSVNEMRREVERYFEEKYKLNSFQSSKIAEFFYQKFDYKYPLDWYLWRVVKSPMKKKFMLTTLQDFKRGVSKG